MSAPGLAVRAAGSQSRAAYTPLMDLRMSGLLVLSLGVAMGGFHSILTDFSWWLAAFSLAFVIFAAAAVARHFLRMAWTGTVAAVVVGGLVITLFFSDGTALLGLVPGPATFAHFGDLMQQANDSIAQQTVPAVAITGIQFMICWAIGGIAVLMDAVALWWRAPALAGVPLLVILAVPSLVRAEFSDAVFFVLTAILYLLIVRNRTRRIQPGVALAVGGIAVVGALLVPLVLPPISPAAASGSGIGSLTESVNPIINLGRSLRNSDPVPALSYTTTSSFGQYLRLTTLETFQGQEWEPSIDRRDSKNDVNAIASPPGLGSSVSKAPVITKISVANTTGSWLPAPYPTSKVTGLKGAWYWQSESLAIRSDSANMEGQNYTTDSLEIDPTATQLRAAPTDHGARLAKVPAGLDPIVAATAKKVVGNAKTDFDKAIALQAWFTGGAFTYSTKTPATQGFDGSGLRVIVPFLKTKSGYCVHFATTMAVMARTLGIPSRVAVGFLPGRATHPGGANAGGTVYQVSSSDLHAWPELYFKGVGWVRFEPTPGRGFEPNFPLTSSSNPSSDPTAPSNITSTPTSIPTPAILHLPADAAPHSAQTDSDPAAVATAASYNWLYLLLLVVLALPALVRIGQRRRRFDRIRRGEHPEVAAWRELRDTAKDLGLDARDSATPAQFADYLAQFLVTATGRKSVDARQALTQLRGLVEARSYGIPKSDENGRRIAEALEAVLRALREGSPNADRLRATFAPATLIDRALGRTLART